MISPLAILVLTLSVLLGALYTPLDSNATFATQNFGEPFREAKNLLLVTAHPDDEAMFFAPTILGLTKRSDVKLFHVCLSNGNADGLGSVRKSELVVSVEILGIPRQRSWLANHPQLQDSFTSEWDSQVISRVLKPYVTELKIDTILTFDSYGVSGHPNHKSLPEGAKALIHNINATIPNEPLPRLFSLYSAPLPAKYISIAAVSFGKLELYVYFGMKKLEQLIILGISYKVPDIVHPIVPQHDDAGAMPVFINSFSEYFSSLSAMTAHASQMVWFRWLYIAFSRYMWANAWEEVRV